MNRGSRTGPNPGSRDPHGARPAADVDAYRIRELSSISNVLQRNTFLSHNVVLELASGASESCYLTVQEFWVSERTFGAFRLSYPSSIIVALEKTVTPSLVVP